jgi:hypothetical protein
MAIIGARGAREAKMDALGCALWAYKLPWTPPPEHQAHLKDEYEAVARARQQWGRLKATQILLSFLVDARGLDGFGGGSRKAFAMLKVAEQAIEEHVNDLCRECHGAMQIVDPITEAVIQTCPVCSGHGKHRYSDAERIAALKAQRDEIEKWNRALIVAHDLLGTADRAVDGGVRQLLERW